MNILTKLNNIKKSFLILSCFMCIWLCIAIITVPRLYGPVTMVKMEFGYMAHAASYAGMDWLDAVSQNTWYSFGYGLLIYPFMKLISDPIAFYRCMARINFLLLGISTLIVYKLIRAIFEGIKAETAAFVSGASLLYVSYITYAQTAIPEVLLTFLYVTAAYGLFRWFTHFDIRSGLFVVFISAYMYTVHMRTVGIALATATCMAASAFLYTNEKGKNRKILYAALIIICMMLLLILTGIVKERLISSVASENYSSNISYNDYSGQMGKFLYLCSVKGICSFLTGLAGKLFYLGCASFGLYYWGIAFLIKKVKRLAKRLVKKESCIWKDWFYLWCLLSHISAVFISNIYWLSTNRLDGILYGRYHENTIPVIAAFGILHLLSCPFVKKRLLWLIALQNSFFAILCILVGDGGITTVNRDSVMGILYALDSAHGHAKRILLYAYIAGMAGSILILAVSKITAGKSKHRGFLSALCVLQLVLALYAGRYYIAAETLNQKEDIELLCKAGNLKSLEESKEAFYLYSGDEMSAYMAQYMLYDVNLRLISRDELRTGDKADAVIIRRTDEMVDELSLYYTGIMESPGYRVYYRQ